MIAPKSVEAAYQLAREAYAALGDQPALLAGR